MSYLRRWERRNSSSSSRRFEMPATSRRPDNPQELIQRIMHTATKDSDLC
jgi:hypothetical protein